MEEIKIRYNIPEAKPLIDKRTGKKGYKIYNFTWYENGKRRKSDTKWHLTKDECKAEAEARIKGNVDVLYIQSKMTVRGLITQYQDYIKNADIDIIAPSTKKNRYDNCTALLKYSTERVLNEKITKLNVDTMKLWLNELKFAKSTRTNKQISRDYYDGLKNTISLILKYADNKNYFHNSLERLTSLKNYILTDVGEDRPKKNSKEFRYMTYQEFQRFATVCLFDLDMSVDNEEELIEKMLKLFDTNTLIYFDALKQKSIIYFYFFVCMFFLGTRAEECRILSWDDVDFEAGKHEGRVSVSKAYTSYYFKSDTEAYLHKLRTKTKGSIRKIPIHPMLKHFLLQYRDYYEYKQIERKVLFPGPDNGFISYAQINHKIERTLIKAGMPDKKFSKHDFRRSCAMCLCYELGLPKDQAISFFGWTSTDMLDEVYAKFNETQRAEILENNLNEVGFFTQSVPLNYSNIGSGNLMKSIEKFVTLEENNDSDSEKEQTNKTVYDILREKYENHS